MKSHCINGHIYDDETTEHRKDGTFACRICRKLRQNYYNALSRGEAVEKPLSSRAADRIADLLLIDAGWLTCPGIAVALGLNVETVHKALYRMRSRGVLEERVVEMAFAARGKVETRREWRHAQAREAWAL